MGLEIERDHFEEWEYARFSERLEQSLQALEELLSRPLFGEGPASLGAELEIFLVDDAGLPLPANDLVLAATVDPRMTFELDRFNLECNLRHGPLRGRPFHALGREMRGALSELGRAAAACGGRPAVIGMLPTLRAEDLQSSSMTDSPRYRALSAGLQRLRRKPFQIRIDGPEPLEVDCDDVTFEGANTSLQLHLRVEPKGFARVYNAVQMATAPVLAVAANSPTLLGHRLWAETRVALFKQAVDDRDSGRERESRVSFGTGWLGSAMELFAWNVRRHPPLIPIFGDEDPLACVRSGGLPDLHELRLHQGTVWRWNRAVYDPAEGGHLRVEMRALPAGPSVPDMLANAAFFVGLALGIAPDMQRYAARFPFEEAHGNFYRAARLGLGAELSWPPEPGDAPERVRARELVLRLLPRARRGLLSAGVDPDEADESLDVIAARARGRTGSGWQLGMLDLLEPELGRSGALLRMLECYLKNFQGGSAVHAWPVTA